jgi:queuosine precursor transporter
MSEKISLVPTKGKEGSYPGFRYLNLIGSLFVATLLISNTAAAKPWQVGQFVFPGGAILFPLSYIFGDVLTEVYGFARCRQIIWTGFVANAMMGLVYWIVIALPPAQFWPNQAAFAITLGQVPRIVFASWIGYLLGEFVNSYVLAKMKIWTGGHHLWTRIIGSTIAGQGVDTFAFVAIAFIGAWPYKYVMVSGASLYTFKVLYEVVATPVTYAIVRFLKEKEGIDHFDVGTQFSPFRWSIHS